jgi:hypothetical protein
MFKKSPRNVQFSAVTLWALLTVLTVAPSVAGQISYLGKSRAKVGLKLGILWYSRLRVDGVSNSTDVGISGGAVFDIPVGRRITTGLALDLHDLHIYNKRKKVLDLSLPIKYGIIFERQHWELRPMAAVGFGYHNDVDTSLQRSTYLTLKFGIETVFHTDTRYSFVADMLVLAMPSGGNRDQKVTFGPTFIIRGGIIY